MNTWDITYTTPDGTTKMVTFTGDTDMEAVVNLMIAKTIPSSEKPKSILDIFSVVQS